MRKGKPRLKSAVVANAEIAKLNPEQIQEMSGEKLVTYLTKTQIKVGIDLAANNLSEETIAKQNKIDASTIYNWKRNNPVFLEFIKREIHNIYQEILLTSYGNKEARIHELKKAAFDIQEKLEELEAIEVNISKRGTRETVNVTSAAYKDLRKELRDTLKDIAAELGQLEEKLNISGTINYHSNIPKGEEGKDGRNNG